MCYRVSTRPSLANAIVWSNKTTKKKKKEQDIAKLYELLNYGV